MGYNEQSIVKALIYSSIFEYPLTKEELWQYAVSESPLEKKIFFSALSQTVSIQKENQFYFLPHEKHIVPIRVSREKIAAEKLRIARQVSRILSKIPMILFIGISGSLAMGNTREEDDIDLFIVTKQHTVWLTRVWMALILEFLGKRRRKYSVRVNNTICINLLIEESHLAFPEKMQNLYTAHEIAQVKPLFNSNNTYGNFLAANMWVKNFLPNTVSPIPLQRGEKINSIPFREGWPVGRGGFKSRRILLICISFLNFLAKKGQLWYMKRQRTSEIITDTVLAFYTNTMQKKVLETYKKKVKEYEV